MMIRILFVGSQLASLMLVKPVRNLTLDLALLDRKLGFAAGLVARYDFQVVAEYFFGDERNVDAGAAN